MITLPHGCRCSELSVHPKNWKSPKASVKDKWYIHYRFYDEAGRVKQVAVRGMNRFSSYEDRKKDTDYTLKKLLEQLQNGFNPFTQLSIPETEYDFEIGPNTPFLKAIEQGMEKVKCNAHTKVIIKGVVKSVSKVAVRLRYDSYPISNIMRRHVKRILQECQADRSLSAGNYNHYRAYLMMIFRELVEVDAIENNPVTDIKKQVEVKKIRETLNDEQRKLVNDHLYKNHKTFWRYLHIFFHSGSRSSELLLIQGRDVNLQTQYFKRTVIKGQQRREVKTIIKDVALPLWTEIMSNCEPDQYVFSRNLRPGNTPIQPYQITKRWYKNVKKALGITADFYSLKHTHSDEVAKEIGLAAAGQHNSHTSTKTTLLYTINEKEREAERIKKLINKFA